MRNNPEISIILPCRNEEKALPICIKQIKDVVQKNNLSAEIIVSDSSCDKSPEIARREKVILIKHDKEGYGVAYLEAFAKAKGKYIFMADADGSYDFNQIPEFISYLKRGYDLVIGNRFSGKMQRGSMPFLHRAIGNPILSGILRLFFRGNIKDSHSGMRAIKRESLDKLKLKTTGMEFASEMIIKALNQNLSIKEVPIAYNKRIGSSKLKSFSDGWRHLRFMLLYSPLFLFFIPGVTLFSIGILSFLSIYFSLLSISNASLQIHPLFICSLMVILGYQIILFSIFTRTYASIHLDYGGGWLKKAYRYFNLETASILGIIFILLGVIIYLIIFQIWANSNFGELNQIKNSILGLTLIVVGFQTIFSAFMLSILSIKQK
jgi:glycosyltransferase involved in cell wall biosynthesis